MYDIAADGTLACTNGTSGVEVMAPDGTTTSYPTPAGVEVGDVTFDGSSLLYASTPPQFDQATFRYTLHSIDLSTANHPDRVVSTTLGNELHITLWRGVVNGTTVAVDDGSAGGPTSGDTPPRVDTVDLASGNVTTLVGNGVVDGVMNPTL